MKSFFKATIFIITSQLISSIDSIAQDYIPLVYTEENTGKDYPIPTMPSIDKLQADRKLPNPFMWASGKGEVKKFKDWERRRNEIMAMIQHYEVGEKPYVSKDSIDAIMDGDTLRIKIHNIGKTLDIDAVIAYPKGGSAPYPAIIGIGMGSGSLPSDIFTNRNIAMIRFNFSQVMSHTQVRGNEPYNIIYPELLHVGSYSAWPWGISRIIDALEILGEEETKIDTKHLAVSGCSFAGKMALFSGAFDERIALTIAQEPGGGGAAAWRVSETLGNVETLGRTNYSWFMESMKAFEKEHVSMLPIDHHELCALIVPRALLVLGNPDYEWLADGSGYVSCIAAREVWRKFGIEDRMGFSFEDKHGHCQLPTSQRPEVEAFVDKFLLGKDTNTTITKAPMFEDVNWRKWIWDNKTSRKYK